MLTHWVDSSLRSPCLQTHVSPLTVRHAILSDVFPEATGRCNLSTLLCFDHHRHIAIKSLHLRLQIRLFISFSCSTGARSRIRVDMVSTGRSPNTLHARLIPPTRSRFDTQVNRGLVESILSSLLGVTQSANRSLRNRQIRL